MSEEEEGEKKIKLKKTKTRLKKITKEDNDNENNNEDLENQLKMQRSKTVGKRRKKRINIDENSEEETTKKRKRKRKRKNKEEKEENNSSHNSDNNEDDIKNDDNNDDEEKTTKKRRRKKRRKKKKSDDNEENEEDNNNNNKKEDQEDNNEDGENNSNNNSDEEKPKKRKRRKKRKKIRNNEEEENNENENNEDNDNEELGEKKKKRRKKRKKKKSEEDDEDNNNEEDNINKEDQENNEENEENEMSKTIKKKRKRKKKKKEKNLSFEKDNNKILIYEPIEENNKKLEKVSKAKTRKEILTENPQRPTSSYILRGVNKTINLKNNFEEGEEKINKKENFDNYDIDWKDVKEKFLQEIEKTFNELNIYDTIDIALTSTTNFTKKEYGDFKIINHHEISPLKNYNNINWSKEPFSLLKEKLYELSSPNNLIYKYNSFDFSNRVCNKYEIYDAKINLLKITGTDLKEKIKPETYTFISKDDKELLKPTLILFFSINDDKSISLFKEIIYYLSDYKEDLIFMPINSPLIQEEKNIYFVMDMLSRHKVYKTGEKFNLYFCMDDALNRRFKYISEDNKRTITNKIVYLDVINDKLFVRNISDLDNFTYNLINKTKYINKKKYKSTIKYLLNLKNFSEKILEDTPLIEPFNCNWYLTKVKIYSISKNDKQLKLKKTFYNGLTGSLKGEHLYFNDKEKYKKLYDVLSNLGNYQIRYNPAHFRLSPKSLNKLVINEMNKCLEMNPKVKEIKYQSIFQTNKIMLSIGSDFGIQKFMPIELNSFKLELQVDIKLFKELEPLNIIGAMQGLTLYTYFNNCDYICCYPKLGEIFPNEFILTDSKDFQEIQLRINPDGDKPSLLIIFSLALQNFFASNELSSRFKLIRNKVEKLYKEKKVNLYLIYRGEPSNFSERFEQIKDDPIFSLIPELYIKSSSNLKFPLIYQNNDIESTDSQIMTFILNQQNKLIYSGNLEDILIDKTFESL